MMSSRKASYDQPRSMNRVLLFPLSCLLVVVPLALGVIYFLQRNTLANADERHASSAAQRTADLISLTYDEVARHYSRMVPAAERSHLELNRELPEDMENVDVQQLLGVVRQKLPEGLHVDVAVVSESLVIHDTTYEPEKGLALNAFADAVADFGVARETKTVSVAFPVVESVGAHVRLYSHMLAPSGRYFTQLAFYSEDADILFGKMRELLAAQGSLKRADIFLVSHSDSVPMPHVFNFNKQVSGVDEDRQVSEEIERLVGGDAEFRICRGEDEATLEYYRKVDLDAGLVGKLPFGAVVCVHLDTQEHLRALSTHRFVVLVALLIVLAAVVLAIVTLRRDIQDPLSELAAHIDRQERVPPAGRIHRTSELSLIAERFNEHLATIQSTEVEQRSLYAASEQRVRDRTERLRVLSRRLLSVQEDEMRRISMELHDGFGQTLVGLRLKLHCLSDHLSKGEAKASVETVEQCGVILDQALTETRHLIDILRPAVLLGSSGLAGALEWLGGQYGDMMEVRVTAGEGVPTELGEQVAVSVYRIAQEAISNAMKHSGSTTVNVGLNVDSDGRLSLVVEDDGSGFLPDEVSGDDGLNSHYGLESMRERAELSGGSLSICSSPGEGTRIEAQWPLNETKPG